MHRIPVGVLGASGYAGRELCAIVSGHPGLELAFASANSQRGERLRLGNGREVTFIATDDAPLQRAALVFSALPHGASGEWVERVLAAGARAVDLSTDLRPGNGATREAPYGLTEVTRDAVRGASAVANPGCYPTSILLALRPLTYLLDRTQPVICDSKSGVSGAGKKADVAYSFSELFGNFKAYGVGQHRHEPEIRQGLHLGERASLVFVPHLLPTVRGIYSTMHVAFTNAVSDEEMTSLYADSYAGAPFVRVLPAGKIPELKDVVNTPYAEIGFQLLQGGRRAVIVSVIDNLLKGAASQAVQNFNRMHGYAETEGLL